MQIYILERLHRIAGSDIILVVEAVGDIAGCPGARAGSDELCALVLVVDHDAVVLVELDDVFEEAGIGDGADLHEYAGDRQFDVGLLLGVRVHE